MKKFVLTLLCAAWMCALNAGTINQLEEIDKLVDTKGAIRNSDYSQYLQYEFVLDDASTNHSDSYHALILKYMDGKLFMSDTKGAEELFDLFPYMKLGATGTESKWRKGVIVNASTNTEIANEINRVLNGMSMAQKAYNERGKQAKKHKEEVKRREQIQSQLSNIVSFPLGDQTLNWFTPAKKWDKVLRNHYPDLKLKGNIICGNISNPSLAILLDEANQDALVLSYVSIDLNTLEEIVVTYKYQLQVLSNDVKKVVMDISEIFWRNMRFKEERGSEKRQYSGVVNDIKVSALTIENSGTDEVVISFKIIKDL